MIFAVMECASATQSFWKRVGKYRTHMKKTIFLMMDPTLFQNNSAALAQPITVSNITQ